MKENTKKALEILDNINDIINDNDIRRAGITVQTLKKYRHVTDIWQREYYTEEDAENYLAEDEVERDRFGNAYFEYFVGYRIIK